MKSGLIRRIIIGLVLCQLLPPSRADAQSATFKPRVIPMKIADGEPDDPGRVFSVPVTCNGVAADFELGCFGTSRISTSFARRCRLSIVPDPVLDQVRDPQGKPIFDGAATAAIEIGGQTREVSTSVMKDEYCQKPEREGLLGFDVIRDFQWELDPAGPTLTLRPAATVPARKPLAILPMRVGADGYYLKIRIRNVTQDMGLMPGSSFIQAGLSLQRAWDFNSGEKINLDVNRFGEVRTTLLRGNDFVELSKDLRETDLPVALMGNPKGLRVANMVDSGLGQCVLNRFVYCVEPRRQQFRIMSRMAPLPRRAATMPSKPR